MGEKGGCPLVPAEGTFSFTRRSTELSGASYAIYTSTDLLNWTEDAGAVLEAGDPDLNDIETVDVTLSASAVNGRLFVQIVASED